MVGYVIVYTKDRRRRVRTVNDKGEAELSPFFQFPAQALSYIVNRLENSPAITFKRVGGKPDGKGSKSSS